MYNYYKNYKDGVSVWDEGDYGGDLNFVRGWGQF